MKFLLACGGTAGHINPAISIASGIKKIMPDSEFLFVGSGREMENRLIPAAGFEIKNIKIHGFERGLSLNALKTNIGLPRMLIKSARDSAEIIRTFRPDAVIGTGGYVCYPVLKEAHKMKIPTAIHESNAVPGLTTKLLESSVNLIMVAFPEAISQYKDSKKVRITGTPVRSGFAELTKEEARKKLEIGNIPVVVVSFWGSLGASKMNEIMADFIADNCKNEHFHHIHATGGGENGLAKMIEMLRERGVETIPEHADIRPYINDMDTVMTAADVVLCRAGASTIAELTAMGKPSVLVPSPYVTNNHQEKNARALEKLGGTKVILESECTAKVLIEAVTSLTENCDELNKMSTAAADAGDIHSTDKIIDNILSLLTK